MRERKNFAVKKLFGSHLRVEKSVEVGIDNDLLLPVLHGLLVFINVHLKSNNIHVHSNIKRGLPLIISLT